MNKLVLSRFISDHMILQHGKKVRLWGWDEPGRRIDVSLKNSRGNAPDTVTAQTVTDDDGRWSVLLGPLEPMKRGDEPLTLDVSDDAGDSLAVDDVLVGEVWYMSGQSNMDLMIERVRDRYPDVLADCEDPFIRTFKISELAVYKGPLEEPESGRWMSACRETIEQFSATGYFFAKELSSRTDMPVGFLHASLGGSKISSWMTGDMLSASTAAAKDGYPDLLEEAERYADDGFIKAVVSQNEENAAEWNGRLNSRIEENRASGYAGLPSGVIDVPRFLKTVPGLEEFCGCIVLKKSFTLSESELAEAKQSDRRVRVFLGTLTDRDEVFLNGTKIGETFYQYPPRKYDVSPELLKTGGNEIEIRLVVEGGIGRLTPEKRYSVFCEKTNEITKMALPEGIYDPDPKGCYERPVIWEKDLSGNWDYQVTAKMEPVKETDFINWHPTGLYNGMAAPCHKYTIGGIGWYQGEANTNLPYDYCDMQRRMISGYRRLWNDEELPFIYVQLPNFVVDLTEDDRWQDFRERQRECLSEPGTGMVCAIDLGEDYDLHPHGKRELGRRMALIAAAMRFGSTEECHGPECVLAEKVPGEKGTDGGKKFIRLTVRHADGIAARNIGKGADVNDFCAIDEAGGSFMLRIDRISAAEEDDEKGGTVYICLTAEDDGVIDRAVEIRYIDSLTYNGAVIYNGAGIPMAPFRIKV